MSVDELGEPNLKWPSVRFTHDALLDLDAGGDHCIPEGVAQICAALEATRPTTAGYLLADC